MLRVASGMLPAFLLMQNFRLTILTFRVNFTLLNFLRFALSKILSQSQFQAAELKQRQFNAKSQMKSAPKLVSFFTLIVV